MSQLLLSFAPSPRDALCRLLPLHPGRTGPHGEVVAVWASASGGRSRRPAWAVYPTARGWWLALGDRAGRRHIPLGLVVDLDEAIAQAQIQLLAACLRVRLQRLQHRMEAEMVVQGRVP